MINILLIIHLCITLAMIGVVLLQRSEGGGLASGGGGGLDNLLSGHSKANLLTRLTAILAACFMISSLVLAIIANRDSSSGAIVEEVAPVSPENTGEIVEPSVPLAN